MNTFNCSRYLSGLIPTGSVGKWVGAAALATASAVASAGPIGTGLDGQIDFRSDEFGACSGLDVCEVGNLFLFGISGNEAGEIYWDNVDGLGILGGQEDDEIDGANEEGLFVGFESTTNLLGVWFTDLFSGGNDPTEHAATSVLLSDGTILEFLTLGVDLPGGTSNGEVFLDFGGPLAVDALFFGTPSELNDDHSIAGLVLGPVNVPEPGTLGVMALGLAAFGARRRWKRSA